MSSSGPVADAELPDINDRLVEPETPYEICDGEIVHVSPADPPHGKRHSQLCALIEAHTGPEFESAADLLTRTSRSDDIAPDVSVFPAAPDPATGGRQLEHLAFEIVSKGSLRHAGENAAKLARRGVRRVFAIDIKRSRALEWSARTGAWRELDPTGHIADRALEVPLPIAAVIHNARADDAVARALLAKRNPVLVQDRAQGKAEGRAEGRVEGRAEGRAEAVIVLLTARGVAIDRATRARILAERNAQRLGRWIVRAASCTQAAELFVDGRRAGGTEAVTGGPRATAAGSRRRHAPPGGRRTR
jgi:Uma2 family endonuclease